MAAGKWKLYESAKESLGDGTIDLDTATFKMALFQSTSNCNTLSGSSVIGDLTNEVANGNGYTTGGVTLTGVAWTNLAGTMTLDSDNAAWTAAGGSIAARFAVIYQSTGEVLCVSLLDTTPADVSVTNGNILSVAINASGIFQSSGATTD